MCDGIGDCPGGDDEPSLVPLDLSNLSSCLRFVMGSGIALEGMMNLHEYCAI